MNDVLLSWVSQRLQYRSVQAKLFILQSYSVSYHMRPEQKRDAGKTVLQEYKYWMDLSNQLKQKKSQTMHLLPNTSQTGFAQFRFHLFRFAATGTQFKLALFWPNTCALSILHCYSLMSLCIALLLHPMSEGEAELPKLSSETRKVFILNVNTYKEDKIPDTGSFSHSHCQKGNPFKRSTIAA